MPFQTTLPGLRESSLDKIVAAMTAKIADLNTALASIAPAITGITVVSGQFNIGDPETMPDVTANPFWVAVVGGCPEDEQDMEIDLIQSGPGFNYTLSTNIFWYLHPDSLPGTSAAAQAGDRERLRARFSDWLRSDVFANGTNIKIVLGSREFNIAPDFDTLDESYLRSVHSGYAKKSFGPSTGIYYAHFALESVVYGGS